MTQTTLECRSLLQFTSLGPPPPRMPGRPDAQVPTALDDGPSRYARFASLYFYVAGKSADPAFGFVDVEISVQQFSDGRSECEAYCVGDGYQSGDGKGEPLILQFAAGESIAASVEWQCPEVRSGTADPIIFRAAVALSQSDFELIDRVIIQPTSGVCRVDLV